MIFPTVRIPHCNAVLEIVPNLTHKKMIPLSIRIPKENKTENIIQFLKSKPQIKRNKKKVSFAPQEYNRTYYENHKESRQQKVQCECGRMVSKEYLKKHKLRDIHINTMNSLGKIRE